jgi:hypothetical protein
MHFRKSGFSWVELQEISLRLLEIDYGHTISRAISFPRTLDAALSTSKSPGHIFRRFDKPFAAADAEELILDKVVFEASEDDFFHPACTTWVNACEAVFTERIDSIFVSPSSAFCFPFPLPIVSFVASSFASWSAVTDPVFVVFDGCRDCKRRLVVAIYFQLY